MAGDPSFAIPARPRRRYPFEGGVEYEGETIFCLRPSPERDTDRLAALVVDILEAGPYRYGDFLELPMPLYLVRDEGTGDVFRVSVRAGVVRLHVLPETDPEGLRAMYGRLNEHSSVEWDVQCRTDGQA